MRSVRTRLEKLEKSRYTCAWGGKNGPQVQRDPTHAEWLEDFTRMTDEGFYEGEPDIRAAVAEYAAALDEAAGGPDPPSARPPNLDDGRRWPRVNTALDWLAELMTRRVDGIPPCSLAEFDGLAAWFWANEAGLGQAQEGWQLPIGDEKVSLTNVRVGVLGRGKALRSGEVAQTLRRLRQQYGAHTATARCSLESTTSATDVAGTYQPQG